MLVTGTFVKLMIGTFLSVASATPVTPYTPALLPRVVPADSLCRGDNTEWVRRECLLNRSSTIRTWREICRVHLPGGLTITNEIYSTCPPQTMCTNIVDETGGRSIKCINIQKPGTVQARTKPTDPAVGASVVQEAMVSVASFDISVSVPDEMDASVTAVVLSTDQTWAIATEANIVGKLKSSGLVVCQGDQIDAAKARQCYPTGRYHIPNGDTVNFTWQQSYGQEGTLEWTIWPSGN